ncbi:hypothetical protein OF117_08735 [Geodermatophilus sp. YIM 151500]|uniref:hypothetical protein n=1 Tax=Geodermatophilus sp. YIM 151500 TaxID=2984531 RepID=UPI0021E4C8D9|nr:hypothetical protein [Geodermatophilus sp. YIM 151500]MCV2489453.1 hypothetical protein [Geodermatophilus sp. YIM 151500]
MTNARPNKVEKGAVVNVPGGHDHGTGPRTSDTTAAQLGRRRRAALRCEPLPDGRRDPLNPANDVGLVDVVELDAWARALAHLRTVGLVGLPPAHVRRALGADPRRYGPVLPRRCA